MSKKGASSGRGATVDRAARLALDQQGRVALAPAFPIPGAAGEQERDEQSPGFRQLLAIVRRHRRIISRTTAIGAVLLTIVALLVPPRYTAMAQIEVIVPGIGVSDKTSQVDLRAGQMLIDNHVVMLKSRDFLLKVLLGVDGAAQKGAARQAVDRSSAREHRGIQKRLDEFEKMLSVNQMLSSSVIAIRITSWSPDQAADNANRLVRLYVDELRLAREAHLKGELERLARRALEVSRGLDATLASTEQRQIGTGTQELSRDGMRDRVAQPDSRANAQSLADLMRRQAEISTQLENVAPEVRIVSSASTPTQRSSLNPLLFVVPGIVVILFACGYVVILRDQMDEGLRRARDVEAAVAMPCVGLLAEVGSGSGLAPHEQLTAAPFAPYAEGIRSVVAALGLVNVASTRQTVLLMSSVEGEGRTTLALSLARYAAKSGIRVLVVDFDARNPGLSRLLGLDCGQGLADLVREANDPMAIVRRHPDFEFDVAPMASAATDPLQLLRSEGLRSALAIFTANYDLVILDGPSILGHPEAILLPALADKVLFLVRWGSTPRQIAQNAARQLRGRVVQTGAIGNAVLSVVTRVPMMEHAAYGFGDVIATDVRKSDRGVKPVNSAKCQSRRWNLLSTFVGHVVAMNTSEKPPVGEKTKFAKLEARRRSQLGALFRRPTRVTSRSVEL